MRMEERRVSAGKGDPEIVVLSLPAAARAAGLPILEFEASVSRLVDGGLRHLAVDLAGLERIDSRTIQALLHTTQYGRRQHARLVLVRVPALLSRTIRNLRLEPALPAFDCEEDAVAYLKRVGRGSGQAVVFHPAGATGCDATALALGTSVDGIILRYPWGKRHAGIDPDRLVVGRRLRLRPSWEPGRELTAEIERVEPAADEGAGARDYHLAFRTDDESGA